MATITVFVAGSDRSDLVDRRSALGYTNDINGLGQATFVLADVPSGFVPEHGQEVLIKEDAVDVFGGTIQTRPRNFRGPDSSDQLTFYQIDVAGWEQRLTKRRVWRQYVGVLFEDIVADLNTDFLDDEGITLDILAGTAITITFNGESVAEAMDLLCSEETDGRTWYVTPAKVLTVNTSSATPAPATLDADNVELNNPEPSIEPDDVGYANVVTVVGGNPELPIMYTAEDAAEIADRKAKEGGSGIHHDTVEDNELVDAGQVQQRAEGILIQRKQVRQRFTAMTNVSGFAIGQEVEVELPNLGITGPKPFFIISIDTEVAPGVTELWHTITAVDGPIDGGWQSAYRRSIAPKTIPMQIEATPGLVRVDPRPGVLIHDPEPSADEVFQGPPSGTVGSGNACAISHESQGGGGFMYTLTRGGLANTGGCGGGTFPGCPPSCHAVRQSILSGFAIDELEDISSTATFCASWDELFTSSFKGSMVVSDDGTMIACIERNVGFDPVVIIVGLDGSGKRGSVAATGMVDNNTGFEGAWVGGYLYIPSTVPGGVIFVFDVSDPDNPALETAFNTSATGTISSVVPNAAGTALYAKEEGGTGLFIALNITTPTAITEADTLATADKDYPSLDVDEESSFDDPQLIALHRADASNIRYARLPLTDAHTFGTLDEDTVAVSQTLFDGWHCLYNADTAIAFRDRVPTGFQEGQVFNIDPDDGVSHVKTLTYADGVAGNLEASRSYIGHRLVHNFVFGTSAIVTYFQEVFDKIVPYEIEKPLRTDFGGTGVDGKTIQKGDLLVGKEQSEPFVLLDSIAAPEGAALRKRAAEELGMAWEEDTAIDQAGIMSRLSLRF